MTVHFGFLRCLEYARIIQFRPKMKEGEKEMVKEGYKYERLVVERKEVHRAIRFRFEKSQQERKEVEMKI